MSADSAEAITRRYPMLGVEVSALTVDDLLGVVQRQIEAGGRRVITYHNLHSVYLYHHDPRMRAFCDLAACTFIDGTPLVRLGRLLGYPMNFDHRITSLFWIRPLLRRAVGPGWRVYFLGGEPGQAERAAALLRKEIPGVTIASAHGYFNPARGHPECDAALDEIARFRPHILCLGMGMPRQERWVVDNYDRIEANVIFNLGALFGRLVGDISTPPLWVSRTGLEWLQRLVAQPGLTWRRYLVEPWALLPLLLRDLGKRLVRRMGT